MADPGPVRRARENHVVLVPIVALLFGDREDVREWWDEEDAVAEERETDGEASRDGALSTLRDRYARGELTHGQFERKLDRLLETETIEDLEDRERATPTEVEEEDADVESEPSR